MRSIQSALILGVFAFAAVACGNRQPERGPLEQAGHDVDHAAQQAEHDVNHAVDEAREDVDESTEHH